MCFFIKLSAIKILSFRFISFHGITAEHLHHSGALLHTLLARLMSAILVHGYISHSLTKTVIVLIVNNKNKRVSDKDKYRPIYMSTVCTKILEKVILNRTDVYHSTTDSQG